MEMYNYVMALLSLCACARSATHDMIKTHTTRAHENTSSTHDLHHMNEIHHKTIMSDLRCMVEVNCLKKLSFSSPGSGFFNHNAPVYETTVFSVLSAFSRD